MYSQFSTFIGSNFDILAEKRKSGSNIRMIRSLIKEILQRKFSLIWSGQMGSWKEGGGEATGNGQ